MSYVEKGYVWIKGRHRLRVDVSKQIGKLIKKHEASSTAEETLNVLLDSVLTGLVYDAESKYDMVIYLERMALRLRDGAGSSEG